MDAQRLQAEEDRHADAENQRGQGGGKAVEAVLQEEHQDQGACAHGQRQQVGLRQVGDQVDDALPEVALARLQAEELGHLLDGNDQRQAGDEADQHRLGEELGDAPQAQQAGQHGHQAGHQRQRHAQRDELGAVGRRVGPR